MKNCALPPDSYPPFVAALPQWHTKHCSPSECMAAAIEIAAGSVAAGGGPFGAVVVDANGCLVAAGHNSVVAACDSTAHAEVLAIRSAQAALGTHNLSHAPIAPYSLFTTGEPCIMCFGAIWWSGLSVVYSCATKADAERIGFSEGPVSALLWDELKIKKGIVHHAQFERDERVLKVFEQFRLRGTLY